MSQAVKGMIIGISATVVVFSLVLSGALLDRAGQLPFLARFENSNGGLTSQATRELVREESAVVQVVEEVSESVVTVSIVTPERSIIQFSPFGGFRRGTQGGQQRDIGSGFIVDADGLIVTNKHVVDTRDAEYKVILNDGSEHQVVEIIKDPSNDLAILRIEKSGLKPVELGDSGELRVGQFVIAIGTALGEFRQTVTTGVVSGLGRGIEAGSGNPFESFVERLDDVIQTDAAINPGNSGGPLLNSRGEVIGINTAVSIGAENIGFALPVNLIKDGLAQFRANGQFASRPFLGVQYQMISREAALLNEVPEGAFVVDVVPGSSADQAGIEQNDIIVEIDGRRANSENDLSKIIDNYEPGDFASIRVWRNGEFLELSTTLNASE